MSHVFGGGTAGAAIKNNTCLAIVTSDKVDVALQYLVVGDTSAPYQMMQKTAAIQNIVDFLWQLHALLLSE